MPKVLGHDWPIALHYRRHADVPNAGRRRRRTRQRCHEPILQKKAKDIPSSTALYYAGGAVTLAQIRAKTALNSARLRWHDNSVYIK